MILIAHRGNTNGVKPAEENKPEYIISAVNNGYHVEIDVWFIDGEYLLGHDEPLYRVDEVFLENKKFWCHAKNLQALEMMLGNGNIHCFWHQSDDFVLTSNGYIWTQPGKPCGTNSICVLPSGSEFKRGKFSPAGICADDFSFMDSYQDGKFDYVEIGSSCFKTMAYTTRNNSSIRGISVEPVSEYLEELKSLMEDYNSQNCDRSYVNAAIDESTKHKEFYFFDWYEFSKNSISNFGLTGIGSFDRVNVEYEVRKQLGEEFLVYIKSRSVKCLSFEKFASDYKIKDIDVLKIDAEGYDGTIIKSIFNTTKVRPKIIIFERLVMKRNDRNYLASLDSFLKDQGYFVTNYGSGWNSICIRLDSDLIEIDFLDLKKRIQRTEENELQSAGLVGFADKVRRRIKERERITPDQKLALMEKVSKNKLD